MGQQYLIPTVQKAKDWRGDLEILLVGVCSVQIFNIDRTSSYILVLPFTCLATNSLRWWPYELRISLLYGFHRFLHVIPQEVILMLQNVCIVGMVPRKIVCTIFGPRIARIEEPSNISFQPLICLLVKCLYWETEWWGPSSWALPWHGKRRSYSLSLLRVYQDLLLK